MALIRNKTCSIEISFTIKESKEKEWLNYQIETNAIENSGNRQLLQDFSLLNDELLFLDRFYDPELPKIIEGINKILTGDTDSFSFSPIDEKDFILQIDAGIEPANFILLLMVDSSLTNVYKGVRLIVTDDALRNFVNQLEKWKSLTVVHIT